MEEAELTILLRSLSRYLESGERPLSTSDFWLFFDQDCKSTPLRKDDKANLIVQSLLEVWS
tara:strand:+ start:208 stop:390 length:183 start_codon:yes stop_codon:yes gene_type:complete